MNNCRSLYGIKRTERIPNTRVRRRVVKKEVHERTGERTFSGGSRRLREWIVVGFQKGCTRGELMGRRGVSFMEDGRE